MSSSRLNPSVTPRTALAIRLRDRPWNFRNCGSSDPRFATSVPSLTSKLIPAGCAWRSCPLGPFTSTALSSTLTVTPFGIVIGFLPIRDISLVSPAYASPCTVHRAPCTLHPAPRPVLPDVAEDFAADARLHGRAPGHHAARGRQDAGAQAGEHLRHVLLAEIHAPAGTADPL